MRLVLLALCAAIARPAGAQGVLFSDNFAQQDGLITNEYAYQHAGATDAVVSADWQTPSGSLFVQGGIGWTGVPDDSPANAHSTGGTHSAVFRLLTNRGDFGNVAITFDLLNEALTAGDTTPAVNWDGCHVVVRYQNEQRFYYASVDRRDGTALIKKKAGDTYYDLTPPAAAAVPFGLWQKVRVTVYDNADGTVSLALYRDGRLLAQAVDNGAVGGPPYRGVGRAGLRGDNARLKFGHFRIETLAPAGSPAAPAAGGPAITSVQMVGISESSATVAFNTDAESFDHVEYGQTSSYGMETPWSTDASISHTVLLWGLSPNTPYHYKIWAKNRAGGQSSTGDLAFTSTAQADTIPPSVSIISPANGQTLSGSVPLVANATDNVAVAGVSWEIDGNIVGAEITQPPYTYIWPAYTALNGQHTVRAIARDTSNNRGVSNPITITITGAR